jgi:hypothetical protein
MNYITEIMNIQLKIILLLLFTTGFGLLQSCSQTAYRSIYNNLDIVLQYKASSLVTLADEQKMVIKQKIALHHQWHRKYALPRLIPIIRDAETAVKNGFSESTDKAIGIKVQSELKYLMEHTADDITSIAMNLSPEQIAQLKINFSEYAKSAEKNSSEDSEKKIKHRVENLINRLEMYYGNFSSDQEDTIYELVHSSKTTDSVRGPYLRKTQKDFIDLLESGAPAKSVKKYIISWAVRDESFIPKEFWKSFDDQAKEDRRLRILIDHTIITPEQREEGIRKLEDFIKTIQILSSDN